MSAKEALEKKIREVCTVHGTFRLRSGALTDVYFDKYLFEADPILLRQICIELANFWVHPNDKFDYIAGLETGGVPIATVLSQVTHIPTLFIRKEAKHYGTCKMAEGGDIKGKRLLIVEDVVTTGGQVLDSCAKLQEEGAIIEEVCCVIVRDNKGTQNIESKYKFSPLFNFSRTE